MTGKATDFHIVDARGRTCYIDHAGGRNTAPYRRGLCEKLAQAMSEAAKPTL